MSTATIVEPTGVPARMEIRIPAVALSTDITAALIVTERKDLKSRIADSAGPITSADINSYPTRFIASTMITAITTAISRLYALALVPVALAKFSSNVTAKILL